MTTGAAYMGATFTLLMTLGMAAGCVASIIAKAPAIMDVSTGLFTALGVGLIVKHDWPNVWKPLFTGKQ